MLAQYNSSVPLPGYDRHYELKLYKLLLYEEGSFFSRHRDSYREEGHFASVIILLPTQEQFEGGQLIISKGRDRDEQSIVWEWRETADTEIHTACDPWQLPTFPLYYAAFYTDCVHELLPVTRGHRVEPGV